MIKLTDIHTHHPTDSVTSPTMAGIHPWDVERGLSLPDFSTCDIIGETGLDYACNKDKELQKEYFIKHLDVATALGKPVVIHVVRAMEDVLNILSHYKEIKGAVFHGFTGSVEQAQRAIERGYYLSFGHRSLRSSKSREVIKKTPLEQLFCETDDNAEISIAEIYNEVAEIREISPEELIREIEKNYIRLFRK